MHDIALKGSGFPHRDVMPGWVGRLRRLVFGKPVPSAQRYAHRLPVALALAVFASDALSSVAYATEEVLIVLAAVYLYAGGPSATGLQIAISVGIAILIAIVAFSYRMAIAHYPTSGGSYTVAKNNLGMYPGLVAAAALAIDYIMTVAVSVSAGVAALTSAVPSLFEYRVWIAVGLVVFIALVNLRGVREAGWVFALPAYSFITMIFILCGTSLWHIFVLHQIPHVPVPEGAVTPVASLSILVILRAFSNGCSAMTGVEAVSNGVSAFKVPEVKHAQQTLLVLAVILILMFLGTGVSAHYYGIIPSHHETVISQLARANFGSGLIYQLVTYSTLLILMVAANTSYADFPRLLSIVASDGYAPRIFTQLGDKLVYNRGIYTLSAVSILLVILFKATVNSLIPLYAVGVFLCFTLSQFGMARKMHSDKKPHWRMMWLISTLGALITGIVTLVIIEAKFMQGAWVVVLLIPLLVWAARSVKSHYDWFVKTMTVEGREFSPLRDPAEPLTVITLVSDLNRGALEGLDCALDIAGGREHSMVRALNIEIQPEYTERLRERWRRYVEPYVGKHVRFEVQPSPYRWLIPPVLEYIERVRKERPHDRIVVVIPEFETGGIISRLLHNASSRRLYDALVGIQNLTVVTCRFFIRPRRTLLAHCAPLSTAGSSSDAHGHSRPKV